MKRMVKIPKKVQISVEGREVTVEGPKGTLTRDFGDPRFDKKISIEEKDNDIIFESLQNKRKVTSMLGTLAAHLRNMITGVLKGYRYVLKISYVHFPMNVNVENNSFVIKNFLGEKGERTIPIDENVNVDVKKDEIVVEGIDKEKVGQTAANIEQLCKIGAKDRRVFQDGIFIMEKGVQNE